MPFSQDAWQRTGDIRDAVAAMPFIAALADGSLEAERFRFYMTQDALYLADYSRALASVAVRAPDAATGIAFAGFAQNALLVERSLHESMLSNLGVAAADVAAAEPSPTCLGYTRYLLGLAHAEPVEVLMAGVLPCFWIYWEVGHAIKQRSVAGNPYQPWIDAYGDPAFGDKVEHAKALTDRAAATATEAVRARMHAAYRRASQYEWMFWDSAWRLEAWPV